MSALKRILLQKSDQELLFYINNIDKHTEEAVWEAFHILQARNVELPEDLKERIEAQLLTNESKNLQKNAWDRNVVEDLDAPALFSQKAIYIFSFLFSVLFGSGMLAYNLYQMKRSFIGVLLFGIGYTILAGYVLSRYDVHASGRFIANGFGTVILYQWFWNRLIGSETKYSAKEIWIPLVFAIIFNVFIIWVLVRGF